MTSSRTPARPGGGSDPPGLPASSIQHGTYYGWTQHNRQGSTPCEACRQARNDYRNDWRQTRRNLGLDAT